MLQPPDEVLGLPAPQPSLVLPTAPPLGAMPPAVMIPPPPVTPATLGVAPVPPGSKPRLIVKNICPSLEIWIASSANVAAPRNVRIPPNGEYKYHIPAGGLSSTRFWPKIGCNAVGQKCAMGSSGGDGQDCPKAGCAPPVDSKFEASFGVSGVDCRKDNKGCDWWDTSAVDGYTLPYRVQVSNCPQGKDIDCRGLGLHQCPANEWLQQSGSQDLRVIDPTTKKVVGCYSPCGKLTYSNWFNPVGKNAPNSEAAKMYCCPTPPVSSKACRRGPVENTAYVKLIHQNCPSVYGYAYDDADRDPASTLVAPAMRIHVGLPGGSYGRTLTGDDVLIVPELLCAQEELSLYHSIVQEIQSAQEEGVKDTKWASWKDGCHLINKAPECSEAYRTAVAKIIAYFRISEASVYSRFNWYVNGADWKPLHHDTAAFSQRRLGKQNITVGVSLGGERELVFRHVQHGTLAYFPQPNGMAFSFGRRININWKHGINALPVEKHQQLGRISIILWGWSDLVDEDPGDPGAVPKAEAFQRSCRQFQKGKCTYGDRCKFTHVDEPAETAM